MRLKTFHADSLKNAMELVREQLGDDAIIVSTQEGEGLNGARVTAAIEQEESLPDFGQEEASFEIQETISLALERNGAPADLIDRIVAEVTDSGGADAQTCLTTALENLFDFKPLDFTTGQPPIMLIGPPGTGKTTGVAKLAARNRLEDRNTRLVAADQIRIAAVDQLNGYAEKIGCRLLLADGAETLAGVLAETGREDVVLIDTPGTNPYNLEQLAYLVELAETMAIEPVLVLNAGRDWEEASDVAKAFRPVSPKRLLVTGVDIARRMGSMLAAADAAGLAFSDISPGPGIVGGMEPLTSEELARRLLLRSNGALPATTKNDRPGK